MLWGLVTLICIFIYALAYAKGEDRKRKKIGQPHTFGDDAELLLCGLLIVGFMGACAFIQPLQVIFNSELLFSVVFGAVTVGLTYLFNRKLDFKSRTGHKPHRSSKQQT